MLTNFYLNQITYINNKANVAKCANLGWVCIPVVAESYGAWGLEAMDFFSKLASRMATSVGKSKSVVLHKIYGRLSMHIVRAKNYNKKYKLSLLFHRKLHQEIVNNLIFQVHIAKCILYTTA